MAAKVRGPEKEAVLHVGVRGVISLPKELRGNASIFCAHRRPDGVIELHPKALVNESQAWFWTERWQKMEREAQAAIDGGAESSYGDAAEMFADLDAYAADAGKQR